MYIYTINHSQNTPYMSSSRIEELRSQLTAFNEAYRMGNALIPDALYDSLSDELLLLSPEDEFFNKVGITISDDDPRKQRLPIPMASMNKVKLMEDIFKWLRLKHIPLHTMMVLTPKLDGLSFCVEENIAGAWTRGDGEYGQRSDEHLKAIIKGKTLTPFSANPFKDMITFGEVLMRRDVFAQKWAEELKNPRNTVAGALNNKLPTPILSDLDFIRYGLVDKRDNSPFQTKSEQLAYLNTYQPFPVPYLLKPAGELSETLLKDLFAQWNTHYELDGIIIEVDSLQLQKEIGRETSSNNPAYARAYKGNFEEVSQTSQSDTTWNVSKQGLLKPIVQIEPIRLDGVTVSNITANNARYFQDMGLGKGAILKVKRSGMVIPLIVEVVQPADVQTLPCLCPSCKSEVVWNENKIELMCLNPECPAQALQRMVAFFSTLGIDNVGEGVCEQFYGAGFDTIHKVVNMTRSQMEALDRFGKRKAEIVHTSIHSKLKGVSLSKLQHATGFFKGLGSKKLLLLEHFEQKPTVEEITAISGFSRISAAAYISAYDKFFDFISTLPLTIEKTIKAQPTSSQLQGSSFCFTGVRRADLEKTITDKGGKVASGVSSNLTYLVMKSTGSGSSKETKALSMGVKILTVEELEALLT